VTAANTPPSTLWELFAAPPSPFAAEAEMGTRAWVRRLRMVRTDAAGRRFDSARLGRLTGRVYGTANRADLRLTTDWIGWLFLVDDQADEGAQGQLRRLKALLAELARLMPVDGGVPTAVSAGPLAAGLADLWRRTAGLTSPGWRRRFVRHMVEHFQAGCWEATNRGSARVPELATFVPARRAAGGLWPALDLVELVEHADLPDTVYRGRRFQTLLATVCDTTLWTKDLFSAEQEQAGGDVHNLVVVLQHAYGCSAQAAADRVRAMVDGRMRLFIRTEQQLFGSTEFGRLSARRQDELLRCIRLARAWVRGHLDWALESAAYGHVEHRLPGQPASWNAGGQRPALPAADPAS
jgi:hypothetical protein